MDAQELGADDRVMAAQLQRGRTELLDLSTRNRLIHLPQGSKSSRTVDIVDELSSEVFRLLVGQGKTFTFLPGRRSAESPENDDEVSLSDLAQPEDDPVDDRGVAQRHSDTKLQTRLTSEGLQKRLLSLHYDAKALEEEQGVNILFLAMGMLKWFEDEKSEVERCAPLILIPVALERGAASERFRVRWLQEEPSPNLSLVTMLKRMFGIVVPEFADGDDESFDPNGYFTRVAAAVSSQPRWEVLKDEMVLGFFSFAKFLMYRDLDPAAWPKGAGLFDSAAVRALLGDGFPHQEPLFGDDDPIDEHIGPEALAHIVDADSSQTAAIHEARAGRHLVIQGPPGTGKSQTIANVIAAAVIDRKKVLFVAEKMAALEVVKARLDNTGVGDMCLELHSNKANKRLVLQDLQRTWELGKPNGGTDSAVIRQLGQYRDALNRHAARLHVRHEPSGLTPYQVIGHLVELRAGGQRPASSGLTGPVGWSRQDREERELLIKDLADRVADIGRPREHPWYGVRLPSISPMDLERLMGRLNSLAERLSLLAKRSAELAPLVGEELPASLDSTKALAALASRVAVAPDLDRSAITGECWGNRIADIDAVVTQGGDLASRLAALDGRIGRNARTKDVVAAKGVLDRYGLAWMRALTPDHAQLRDRLSGFVEDFRQLQATAGTTFPTTLDGARRLLCLLDRCAAAPDLASEAMVTAAWADRFQELGELVLAGKVLASTKDSLSVVFSDAAWDTEVKLARQHLAMHGRRLLRFLNSDYRRAKLLLQSIIAVPVPKTVEEQVHFLDQLITGQRAAASLVRDDELGREAFGAHWRGERSDWARLGAVVDWMGGNGDGAFAKEVRRVAASGIRASASGLASRLGDAGTRLAADMSALLADLTCHAPKAFPAGEVHNIDLVELSIELDRLRAAATDVAEIFSATPPASKESQLQLLTDIAAAQLVAMRLEEGDGLGRQAFGSLWRGEGSDWPRLRAIVEWARGNGSPGDSARIRRAVSLPAERQSVGALAMGLAAEAPQLAADITTEADWLAVDIPALLGIATDRAEVGVLANRLALWMGHPEDLSKWIAYSATTSKAGRLGLSDLADRLEDGRLDQNSVLPEFRMAYFEALFSAMIAADPELARFDGESHQRIVQEFREVDQKRIRLARLEVAAAHHTGMPPMGGAGAVGVLKGEFARKRGHMPIRQLMKRAGAAIQAIKPVFMMSPLSVAQFLEPGALKFDLLVIDEASQIQPVDALGAIARCDQMVIVGDDKQLPPTRFFDKVIAGDDRDDDDDGTAGVGDVESILGLCVSKGLPQKMLRWHYRSRHHSLIAVSNSQFYDNRLYIVPSPYNHQAGMGLRFNKVADGVYDGGKTATNEAEAVSVAQAVIRHAREHAGQSLGVAAFSTSQRRAILDEVERLRRLNPDAEHFFAAHPAEPFFVKNLENVQGDERDVIFISVGYGRNRQGYMSMNFGPLNRQGGERRLNVLISRARRRCEVFASITDEDIDLERAKGQGVFAFKLFLHFARTGKISMGTRTDRDHDSVFEEQVAAALRARGYDVHPQVGIAGFFVDLAVADFERPGRYVLGIECDGASYHSSRSARDRDRLRQAVLEDHGWIIHRIWSTDWFHRPQEQLHRTVEAIEGAKAELAGQDGAAAEPRAVPVEIVTVEREATVSVGLAPLAAPLLAEAYREAVFDVPRHIELHEVSLGVMAQIVSQVVHIEGPIHNDEIVARVRTLWGLKRSGGRIQTWVGRAVNMAWKDGAIAGADGFFKAPGSKPPLRDRSMAESPSLRKPEMLPPEELMVGAVAFVAAHLGASEEEVVIGLSRLLGFKATSAQLRQVLAAAIDAAVAEGQLVRQGDQLQAAVSS